MNANILRRMALYLLSQTPENISKKRKRKYTVYGNGFLVSILKLARFWCGSPNSVNTIGKITQFLYYW